MMHSTERIASQRHGRRRAPRPRRVAVGCPVFRLCSFAGLSLGILLSASHALAQSPQPPTASPAGASDAQPQSNPSSGQQLPGNISGTVVDPSGAAVAGAKVRLTRVPAAPSQPQLPSATPQAPVPAHSAPSQGPQSSAAELTTGDDGQFSFANFAPGPFQLTISAAGFTTQTYSGTLRPGEINLVPQITLAVAPENTQVQVVVPRVEVAEAEIKVEEKQRVFGVIPNFYVSYIPDAAPLTSKQKFELAWRTSIDPVTFVLTGAVAGLQQAQNTFSAYGQGAEGYGKRYGAAYADGVVSTFVGSAILPSLLRQDPRYFYKGTGSTRSRILYAVANSVICKGDDKRWQPNYSGILGSIAAGGISNAYYPARDRGADLVFENTAIGIGATAAGNLLQEFLIRKLTPAAHRDPTKP
jgi:Carboxypeptidase regulatory-like domain